MAQRWYPAGQHQSGIYCSQCQAVAWYTFTGSQAVAAKALGGRLSISRMFYCPECTLRCCDGDQLPREMADLYMRRCWARPSQLWQYAGLAEPPPALCTRMSEKIKFELVESATSNFAVSLWGKMAPLEAMERLHPPAAGDGTPGAGTTPALPAAATAPVWGNPAAPTGPPPTAGAGSPGAGTTPALPVAATAPTWGNSAAPTGPPPAAGAGSPGAWTTPALPVAATAPVWGHPAAPAGPPGAPVAPGTATSPTDPDHQVAELLELVQTLHQELIQTTRHAQELAERLHGCHNELKDLLRQ